MKESENHTAPLSLTFRENELTGMGHFPLMSLVCYHSFYSPRLTG
jgi:hypothetical protein